MEHTKAVSLRVELNSCAAVRLTGCLENPAVIRLVKSPLNGLLHKNVRCRLEMPGARPLACTVSGILKSDLEEKVFVEFKPVQEEA